MKREIIGTEYIGVGCYVAIHEFEYDTDDYVLFSWVIGEKCGRVTRSKIRYSNNGDYFITGKQKHYLSDFMRS